MAHDVDPLRRDIMIYIRRPEEVLLGVGRAYDHTTQRMGVIQAPYPEGNIFWAVTSICYSQIGLVPQGFFEAGEWETQDLTGAQRRTALVVVTDFEGQLRGNDQFADPRWFNLRTEGVDRPLPIKELGKEQSEILPRLSAKDRTRFVFDRISGAHPVLTTIVSLRAV